MELNEIREKLGEARKELEQVKTAPLMMKPEHAERAATVTLNCLELLLIYLDDNS